MLVLSPPENWGAEKTPAAPPGTVGAAAGYGQPGAGTVWSRPAGTIQEGLERGTPGGTLRQGGRAERGYDKIISRLELR